MTEQPPADGSSASSEEPIDAQFEPELLGRWERLGASALGLVAGGGGGWAVFTTDNQAGSAVLVVIGAAFLLMGLQGTPLIRVGGADSGVELERRRRRVERAIEQARHEENQEVAAGIVEGASILEPAVFRSLRYRRELYVSKVALALQTVGAAVERGKNDRGPDLVAQTATGLVNIEVKYIGGRLSLSGVRQAESYSHGVPALVVTNAPLSPEVESHNASERSRHVEAVRWNDERDTALLGRALLRVAAAGGLQAGS
ncbi:hypothetical protein [Micromonospora sp. NBS 11-29]|uniref:hypothetical protein n=1 Tax=Micromonospora sp. NBS 11-29 TaxID=1960879 RepID=UPI00111F237E|nr:hypothetical protein [Micromonospora sp. NBS 11-29]